jgi:predicted RNase H-like HicB family nuclease
MIVIEKTNTGYSAFFENLPIGTTGSNADELKANLLEAFELYLFDEVDEKMKSIT